MITELWKDINNYEGFYQVSNLGRVRNKSLKILKDRIDKDGYIKAMLYRPGQKPVNFFVHRIVATNFIENNNELPQVNHINSNKKDNRAENLEWVSARENNSHRNYKRTGMKSRYTGVMWSSACDKWTAQILINKKRMHLGVFELEEDAAKAYSDALEKNNLKNKYK